MNKFKYIHDENAFTLDTQEGFYWAGFIAADGCILTRKGRKKSLAINLAIKDKKLLEELNKFLKSNRLIYLKEEEW